MDCDRAINNRLAFGHSRSNEATTLIACLFDLLQAHLLSRKLLAHGATQKAVLIEDTYDSQVSRVVPDEDIFLDKGCKREIEIPMPLEADSILVHATRFGNREQEEIELLSRVRHAGQEATRFPTILGLAPGLAMNPMVIIREQPVAKSFLKSGSTSPLVCR